MEEFDSENLTNEQPENIIDGNVVKRSIVSAVFDWVETIAFAFCFVVLIFTFLFKVVTVKGPSMNYTLYEGQKLVISSLFYAPERGDIVVIDTPKFNEPIIKRIIALGGDTVDIDFENWIINVTTADGKKITYQNEKYVNYISGSDMGDDILTYPLKVEDGKVFAMGDNRLQSTDSRARGTFDESDIIGKAVFRLWPFDKIGTLYK